MLQQTTSSTTRTIILSHLHDNYDPTKDIGNRYQIVIWIVAERDSNSQPIPLNPAPSVKFADRQGNSVADCLYTYRPDIGATVAEVPIDLAPGGLVITHSA